MPEADLKVSAAQEEAAPLEPAIQEMMDAGVFYGRTRNKTNPRMKQHVLANRNGVEIINVEKTKEMLDAALEFLKKEAGRGAAVMFVGTQPAAIEGLDALGKEFGYAAVTNRWLGGTLTNYRIISNRVEYFKKLKADLQTGAFKGYTKKEQLDLEKEAVKLEVTLAGLENMTLRPEVLIVIDPVTHRTAVAEAKRLSIPIVAFVNTDADPDMVAYPVLGNTKARTSVTWFIDKIGAALREGKALSAQAAAAKKEAATAAAAGPVVPK